MFKRGLLVLLSVCFVAVLGTVSPSNHARNILPSAGDVQKAIVESGLDIGNNPVSQALAKFSQSKQVIQGAISTLISRLGPGITHLLDPEAISYGGSPAVYPSPPGQGNAAWKSAYSKARALVAQMTNDEKNNLTCGAISNVGCSGFAGSVSRLGFPGMCLNDAESGVRTAKLVNGFPSLIHVGASWNRKLAYDRALHLGREFKIKGVNVALGPVIGPIGRLATGGRNWEGFSNDPYLAGALVFETVTGMQKSVIACAKHFITNEQETNRNPFAAGVVPDFLIQSVSSNLDDKTMHETYLWPFYDAVKAGVGSVMCSYNRINNSYACQNSKTINGLLKTELGFEGFVVSDWTAQHTGIASANAGLDLAMPFSLYWDDNQLATAVANKSMNATRLDDMATRILASWYRYAEFKVPGIDNYANVDARKTSAEVALLESAVEGHVLVKNIQNALPLKTPTFLSLFGYDAVGGLNSSLSPSYDIGLENTPNYTSGVPFTYAQAALFFAEAVPPNSSGPRTARGGTLLSGGGSGAITPASSISPADAFIEQAKSDGTELYTDFYSHNPSVNPKSDACIVFINEQSSESWDRSGLADPYSDLLVKNVASNCAKTIVVIHNAGIRTVDEWIENHNVTAVIFAHLPGQYSGNSLVEIIYGRQSPSGRLPYTVAKSGSDYGSLLYPTEPNGTSIYPQSDFSEGNYIDYKHFILNNITPRFEFGYGLTYSSFSYSALNIIKDGSVSDAMLPPDRLSSPSEVAPEGGLQSLYDIIATVTMQVRNTGQVLAAEVPQLYVGIPGGMPKMLRGFGKASIEPGKSANFDFPLRRRDLSLWDVTLQQWVLPRGTYNMMVGKSVLDIQLQGSMHIE